MLLTAWLFVLLTCSGMAVKLNIPPCDQHVFHSKVDDCLTDFNTSVETSVHPNSCPWPAVKPLYHRLKLCVDDLAAVSSCTRHGSLDDFYLKVHNLYFSSCGQLKDPPPSIVGPLVGTLTLLTVVLPILCVFLTTKDIEILSSPGL